MPFAGMGAMESRHERTSQPMGRLRRKLTYSNVVSTLCLFLLVSGGTALAAGRLGAHSVGSRQLKKNAVTAAKVKGGAVTGAKIAPGAVDGSKLGVGAVGARNLAAGAVTAEKLAPHSITADKLDLGALPTVPAPVAADVSRGSSGTLHRGEEAVIFSYGPLAITAQCTEYDPGRLGERFLISSSATGSVFTSWIEDGRDLGPATPEEKRVIGIPQEANSNGNYNSIGPSETNVSASSVPGQGFNAFIGKAAEEESSTCWYWLSATLTG